MSPDQLKELHQMLKQFAERFPAGATVYMMQYYENDDKDGYFDISGRSGSSVLMIKAGYKSDLLDEAYFKAEEYLTKAHGLKVKWGKLEGDVLDISVPDEKKVADEIKHASRLIKEIKNPSPKSEYKFPEAYSLLRYECQVCHQQEVIWNSRDAVAPYCIKPCCQGCEKGHMHRLEIIPGTAFRGLEPLGLRWLVAEDKAVFVNQALTVAAKYMEEGDDPSFSEEMRKKLDEGFKPEHSSKVVDSWVKGSLLLSQTAIKVLTDFLSELRTWITVNKLEEQAIDFLPYMDHLIKNNSQKPS